MDGCPVCAAKSLGAAKMRLVLKGVLTPYDAARDLNCTYDQVMVHINENHELSEDQCGNLQTEDVLLRKLTKNLNTLQEWTDFIVSTVSKPGDVDRSKVQMMTQLTQEIRKTVGEIGELQGRKGPGDLNLQVQILNKRIVDITDGIVDTCCPECQLKILKILEQQPKLAQGGGTIVESHISIPARVQGQTR